MYATKTLQAPRLLLAAVLATAGVGVALAGPAGATPTGPAVQSAAVAERPPACPPGSVCFWEDGGYPGAPTWEWSVGTGHANMPESLHDDVGSFSSNAVACFLDYDPRDEVQVIPGDYRQDYNNDFGSRIDAVHPGRC